jgi:multidrug efflux pump subunit AcrB
MTALAAIFALLPLAIGIGQGSAMLQPLAVAIIGGLVVTVPAVLFLLPVLIRLLAGKTRSSSTLA